MLKELAEYRVGVDNVIFSVDAQLNRLFVLLFQRENTPYQGYWSLPGTLVRKDESLEGAAQRILLEKITVNNPYLEQLYTFSGSEKKNSKGQIFTYLSISYFALLRYEDAQLVNKPFGTATWYNLQDLPELAFEHRKILDYGYQRLRNKLEYSPIAFDVLPELFTLNDLYQLYCTILGENFSDYSNFRSRLLKMGFLNDTGSKIYRGIGRPAKLYRFDAEAFAPLKDHPLVFI
jgi:ADP-ribose pyrophosphatase YjhB (NUDIX family)